VKSSVSIVFVSPCEPSFSKTCRRRCEIYFHFCATRFSLLPLIRYREGVHTELPAPNAKTLLNLCCWCLPSERPGPLAGLPGGIARGICGSRRSGETASGICALPSGPCELPSGSCASKIYS
jgi:hypothetical protein